MLEDFVSNLIDRKFAINGDFDFELGRVVTLKATDVSLQNAIWSSEASMLLLGEVEASVDLFALTEQTIFLTNVEAHDAEVLFEWNGDELNWMLGASDEPEEEETEPPEPLPLIIGAAKLDNVTLRVRNPAMTEELRIVITRGVHQQDAEHRLVLDLQAQLEDRLFTIEGQIGPFPELVVAGAVDFNLGIQGPNADLRAVGDFDWLAKLQDPDFELDLLAPEAAEVLRALKLPASTRGPIDVKARTMTEGGGIVASAVGQFGAVEFDARLDADNLTSFEGFDLTVNSSGPSIRNALALAGVEALRDEPYQLELVATRSAAGLELKKLSFDTYGLRVSGSGIARKLPELKDFDFELKVSGDDYRILTELADLDLPGPFPFAVDAAVTGNGAGVSDDLILNATIGKLQTKVTGSLTEDANFSGSSFSIDLQAPDARNLAGLAGIVLTRPARLDVTSQLSIDGEKLLIDALQVELDKQTVTASGSVDLGASAAGVDVDGRIRGTDLARLASLVLARSEAPVVPKIAYDAAARIQLAGNDLSVKTSRVRVGKSQLDFDGTVNLGPATPVVNAAVSASGASLTELLQGQNIEGMPAGKFSLRSKLETSGQNIFLQGLTFKLPNEELSGDLKIALGSATPEVDFDITARGTSLNKTLPDLVAAYEAADVPFAIAARGTANSARIDLKNVAAELGATKLNVEGTIELEPKLAARGVRLRAKGPRLSDIGNFGTWQLNSVPFELSAAMDGSAGKAGINDLLFRAGESELRGAIRFDLTDKPDVGIELKSKLLDIDEIRTLKTAADETAPKSAAEVEQYLFSEEPLPFEVLDTFNGALNIQIGELIVRKRKFGNLVVEARLRDGAVEAPRIAFDAAAGRVRSNISLQPSPDGRKLALALTADKAMLILDDMTAAELDGLPHYAIDVKLTAAGDSPRQLASSFDGYVFVVGGQGSIRKLNLGPLFGDFITELSEALNPFAKHSNYTKLDCLGLYFEIETGKIRTSPGIVVQSEQMIILASGRIDLATEKIDFTFETTPRKGIGISVGDIVNPFTKVIGTLSAPMISLDPQGTIVEGGTAVATLGISILGKSMWNRWFGSRKICQKIGEKALDARRARDPGNVPDAQRLIEGSK